MPVVSLAGVNKIQWNTIISGQKPRRGGGGGGGAGGWWGFFLIFLLSKLLWASEICITLFVGYTPISEEHTLEPQPHRDLAPRFLLEKKY